MITQMFSFTGLDNPPGGMWAEPRGVWPVAMTAQRHKGQLEATVRGVVLCFHGSHSPTQPRPPPSRGHLPLYHKRVRSVNVDFLCVPPGSPSVMNGALQGQS
ncbi:hypothetical protein AAFF_G00173020 [Aldrovandia affinis]|uniref:Uncharacterized protein n=1 Tax=Aldrovandia affinis TaxID=143900 RepID=A0AAD7WVP1_9TELE|nr:hypothetical protein AAFF_G00173020 [Aldrovandia affinis]